MTECKASDTPMEAKLNIVKKESQISDNPYQQLIGSLMYLADLTRPDIAYSVGYLSQFNNCHNSEHWYYAKRVLRYLKGSKNVGLKYCKDGNVDIQGYVDSDWGSAKKLSANPMFHNRTKHIDIRYHYCREVICNKIVKVDFLPTDDMPADMFTKSLVLVKHRKFMNMMGIVNVL
ncbi:unnamed protein product [Euphydryas editha]|uniref:Copia protein n=1 Tax=Euphydryas editha TaxID=104508 RepID=A0AAU9T8M0_EUPED|nr:unnamed protein product [Euphydryas editha]